MAGALPRVRGARQHLPDRPLRDRAAGAHFRPMKSPRHHLVVSASSPTAADDDAMPLRRARCAMQLGGGHRLASCLSCLSSVFCPQPAPPADAVLARRSSLAPLLVGSFVVVPFLPSTCWHAALRVSRRVARPSRALRHLNRTALPPPHYVARPPAHRSMRRGQSGFGLSFRAPTCAPCAVLGRASARVGHDCRRCVP